MVEPNDFAARFKLALTSLQKPPPALEYDVDSDIPVTLGVETTPPAEQKPVKLAKVTSINLFQQPEAHPVILDLALLRKYGPEWMHWEPETLSIRIPQDFRTSGISDLNMDKIQACKTLHFNDNFWLQWEIFNWCLHPFNNLYPNFEVMQVPSTAMIMVAVSVANALRDDVQWSQEVKDFMRTACQYDGIFYPPAPLEFLEVGVTNGWVDKDEILKRWPGVRSSGILPTQDTILDEQLRRMLDVHDFLRSSQKRLEDQIPLVMND